VEEECEGGEKDNGGMTTDMRGKLIALKRKFN
jgi:hypothetical protein